MALIDNVYYLIKILGYCGVIPLYKMGLNKFCTRIICNVACVPILIFFGINLLSVYFDKILVLPDVITTLILLVTIKSAKVELYNDFFKKFDEFDKLLKSVFKKETSPDKFQVLKLLALIVPIFISLYFVYNILTTPELYIDILDIPNFLIFTLIMTLLVGLIYFLLNSIKKRVLLLYEIIEQFYHDVLYGNVDKVKRIDDVIRAQSYLVDGVDYFNDIFEWTNLFIMVYCVSKILSIVHASIYVPDETDLSYYLHVVVNIGLTMQGLLIAIKCDQVTSESKKVIPLILKALHQTSSIPPLHRKLTMLSQQATTKYAVFTGAGFFNVDYALLFTLTNITVTYVIVIIQFAENTKGGNCTTALPLED